MADPRKARTSLPENTKITKITKIKPMGGGENGNISASARASLARKPQPVTNPKGGGEGGNISASIRRGPEAPKSNKSVPRVPEAPKSRSVPRVPEAPKSRSVPRASERARAVASPKAAFNRPSTGPRPLRKIQRKPGY